MELDQLEKSVTALEIEYGSVLKQKKTLVYERVIVNEDYPEIYHSEDPEHREKLEELKQRIRNLTASKIGYLPQQTVVQKDFPASVYEVVLSGCQNSLGVHLFYSREAKKRALDTMERLGLSDLAKWCYRDLSGGQQQRVLLARALCATEKMLLLDEPVAGLDPLVTNEMYDLIKKLNDEGITVIMISHDIAASVKYAKHILHIGNGFFFGTVEEYKKSAAGSAYLEGGEA